MNWPGVLVIFPSHYALVVLQMWLLEVDYVTFFPARVLLIMLP